MARRSGPLALLVVLLLAGCGSRTHSQAPSPANTAKALEGSPPPLASLHAEANRLLTGGTAAFRARLGSLRGYPVVINKWASWCGPCQSEFPVFQQASVAYGRRVAFLGLDGADHPPAAMAFLRQFPVSYPSFDDPAQSIADSIQAAQLFPQTVFLDRSGVIVYDHAGPYGSVALLEQDIRRYALSPA